MTDYERGVEQASAIYKEAIREYVAENEKLRKACTELYEDQCDECDRWKYRDRMRELGMEADGVPIRIGAMPVDANGVPIRIGDVMEWLDGSTAEVVGIGFDTFFYVEDGEDAAEWSCASDKIHHHEPTVEGMLWELLGKISPYMEDEEAVPIVKAYAEKLRLADGKGE